MCSVISQKTANLNRNLTISILLCPDHVYTHYSNTTLLFSIENDNYQAFSKMNLNENFLQRRNFRRNVPPPSSRKARVPTIFPSKGLKISTTLRGVTCQKTAFFIVCVMWNLRSHLMKSHIVISLRWCYQIKVFSLLHPSLCWNFHYTVHLTWPTHYILCRFSCLNFATRIIFSFAVACWPAWSQWIYIYIYIYIYVCVCACVYIYIYIIFLCGAATRRGPRSHSWGS